MAKKRAFRCSRTGLYFPEDYVEEWGKKYGVGLGPVPVSEALVNDYHRGVIGEGETAMHGISVCRAQVDLVEIDDADPEYKGNIAILDIEDPGYRRRAVVMRDKQLVKSMTMRNAFPADVAKAEARIAANNY